MSMYHAKTILAIDGLHSAGNAVHAIEVALLATKGVLRAYVSPATEMAYVVYDPSLACPDDLARVVAGVGVVVVVEEASTRH